MQNIQIERPGINISALDQDVRAALGSAVFGVSTSGRFVIVHLDDKATSAQVNQVRQIVQSHDPSKLTPAQREENDRKARLEQLRQIDQPLDADGIGTAAADIRRLARKVSLLEAEIAALQKGG